VALNVGDVNLDPGAALVRGERLVLTLQRKWRHQGAEAEAGMVGYHWLPCSVRQGERFIFRENDKHLQFDLFDTVQRLPEKVRRRLKASWADTFYLEVFCRINESLFAVLCSDEASRPNSPINTLVAAEILESGFGWSGGVVRSGPVQPASPLRLRPSGHGLCTL
jgi:hypothetical protein